MKALLPINHKTTIKILREVILLITVFIFLHCFSYAEITFEWNPTTGEMEITVPDGEDIAITKDPTTGGLAINGT